MNLIFDTSIIIDIERGNKDTIDKIRELKDLYPAPAKIMFISYFEFVHGIRNKMPKNKQKAIAFIEEFSVIQTTKATANNLSLLKNKYELPLADLLIASQVIETNNILVTKDNDFKNIEEMNKILI